jgi:hypothetical protein
VTFDGGCTAVIVGVGGLPNADTPRPSEATPKGRGGDHPDTDDSGTVRGAAMGLA